VDYSHALDNNLGPEAAGALVEALKFNQTLVVLNLNRNQLGDEAAHEIASCVATNNSLTILSLAGALEFNVINQFVLLDSSGIQFPFYVSLFFFFFFFLF
jgi:Ran GTPase-activating protein (RanGAP) involved in mRNA processing and transport